MRNTLHRLIAATITMVVVALGLTTSPAGGVAGFGDVDASKFYTEAVQWMVDNDITTGTSISCFSPSDSVTRGQAAAFMWRMEGEPPAPAHSFTDVTKTWQQGPISWMSDAEITTGTTDTTFSPEDVLTRGQLAALLWRLAGEPAAPAHPFTDVTKGWQQGPVSWMADEEITTGKTSTSFAPEDTVTRGEIATFFYRYKGEPSVAVDDSSPACPAPANPGDARDCIDFANQSAAQSYHDLYLPFYGDVANLDADDDGTACEESPGDTKNCGDFSTQAEAQAWFDFYFPLHGDVANLDGDNNGRPCESLP